MGVLVLGDYNPNRIHAVLFTSLGWPMHMASFDEFTNSVHEVFSSTFEANPFRRGKHPFRMALLVAIDTGIHTIRAGRHLCD